MLHAMPWLAESSSLFPARAQMAMTLAFHICFAAVGIGLPLLMVITERLYLRSGKAHYRDLAQKWSKATAILFAVGAVSGTALSFELGLLWPKYMQITGAAVGHLFGLEGFAFFLEAIFLALYIYGWNRLSPRGHWWCGVAVAFFGAASGWLVLGVNAWMQLPVGIEMDAAGNIVNVNPFAIFKTYAWFTMALHSTLACYVAVSFAVAAIYAAGYLRGQRDDYHRSATRIAMTVGTVVAILQPVSGDLIAKFVYRTQPAKFASMESHFETSTHAAALIGGIPDMETRQVRFGIELPGVLSFLATGNPSAEIKGLNDIDRSLWPNVPLVHLSFQVMVGLGVLMMIVGVWFAPATWRKREQALASSTLLRAIMVCGPAGFIALEAGWVVTECGRQPWIINGIMKTADAVTPYPHVWPIFIGFAALYLLLGITTVALLRYLARHTTKPGAGAYE